MSEICPKCGLPQELCVCESIAKESQKIEITTTKKKFGKVYTVITGIDEKEIDMKTLLKKLKSKFACGGTAKDGKIELQGNHKTKVKNTLIESGFAPESIKKKTKIEKKKIQKKTNKKFKWQARDSEIHGEEIQLSPEERIKIR